MFECFSCAHAKVLCAGELPMEDRRGLLVSCNWSYGLGHCGDIRTSHTGLYICRLVPRWWRFLGGRIQKCDIGVVSVGWKLRFGLLLCFQIVDKGKSSPLLQNIVPACQHTPHLGGLEL